MGNATLGALVRSLRETAELSQEELAARAEVSRATVQNLENDRRTPRRASLRRIAAALGTDVPSLQLQLAAGVTEDVRQLDALTAAEAVIQRRELEERLAQLDEFAVPGTAAHTILSEALQDRINDLTRVIHQKSEDATRRPEADTAS